MKALRSRIVSKDFSESDKHQNSTRGKVSKRSRKSKLKTKTTKRESSTIKQDNLNKPDESVVFINETLKYSTLKDGTRDTLLPPIFFNAVTSTAIKHSRTNLEDKLRKRKNAQQNSGSEENSFVSARNSLKSSESDSTIINDSLECIISSNPDNMVINNESDCVLIADSSSNSIKSGSLQKNTFIKSDSSGIIVDHTFTKDKSDQYDAHFFGNSGEWRVESLWTRDSDINKKYLKKGEISTENKDNTQSNFNPKIANKSFKVVRDITPISSIKFTEFSPVIVEKKVNKSVNKILNIPTKNKEKSLIKTPVGKQPKISPKIKSIRKKWENGNDSLLLMEKIASTKKKDRNSLCKNKSPLNNSKANSTLKKIKRTALPNFALIHQRANEKIESLLEYSNRKKDRAKKLLTGTKQNVVTSQASTSKDVPGKSSRNLFESITGTSITYKEKNKSSFKILEPKPNIPKRVPIPTKAPVAKRDEFREIANKNRVKTTSNRDNSRVFLKGVRTNKRFELLMKMRQQQ